MIEAPEARLLADQINQLIKGKQITLVIAKSTPHKFTFYSGDTSLYENRLLGKVVGESCSRGGMLETTVEDMLLIFTDGANLRYYEPGSKLPAKHQLLIGFDDESCLVVSIRMYGGIWCIPRNWKEESVPSFKDSLHLYYETSVVKPQVLSEAFNLSYFTDLIAKEEYQNKSAKAFLATNQTIPGLGNGVLQDILYQARIHPKRKIQTLSPAEKEKLYSSIKQTLIEIYESGGRSSESDLLGTKGKYISRVSKDTAGQPCIRCEEIIQKENYLGGSIYYCPGCQQL